MKFEETFPVRFWLNLGRRGDRRGEMEYMLESAGITAERFPAVDARFVRRMALERCKGYEGVGRSREGAGLGEGQNESHDEGHDEGRGRPSSVRGYDGAGRYALALTQRLAIRRARQRGAEAVLLLEDDAVFHPNFRALFEMLELPEDWGIFYLGCAHGDAPEPAAPGIVRVRNVADTHAVAIRRPYFDRVIRALDAHGKPVPRHTLASDRFLSALAHEIPTYACFPNLAWQAVAESDLVGKRYSQYREGGTQGYARDAVERGYERMYLGGEVQRGHGRSHLGLLFLTRGDTLHPEIWREFVAEVPERVRVFSHPKDETALAGGFLEGSAIRERHETGWGSIGLVRASLALLRAALEDDGLTHFMLLSESCVPVRPLPAMLRHLDWNPLPRFGCTPLEKASALQRTRASLAQVPPGCWRFQSQWWMVDRIAAEWVARADYTEIFAGMGIPDEAYFSTVLNLLGYPVDDRSTGEPVTWTHWEKKAGRPTEWDVLTMERLEEILESGAWFARKFPAGADVGKFGLHRSA